MSAPGRARPHGEPGLRGVSSLLNNVTYQRASAVLLPAVAPAAAFASDDTDRTIETAVSATDNGRMLLGDRAPVIARAGVVRAEGMADSEAGKSLVTKLALDVRGTKSVTNDMVVKS